MFRLLAKVTKVLLGSIVVSPWFSVMALLSERATHLVT